MAATNEPFLTVSELADRLGVSASTIRNWRKAYGDLIPSTTGRDRASRYALPVYQQIAVLYERKLPPSEGRRVLAGQVRLEDVAPDVTFEQAVLAELRAIRAAVERIADRLDPPKEP